MPKCTINGVELEVKEGTTIIEAMTQNEQRIAHYCWHPGLSIAGVCRLCMVEIEGNPRLQIACNTVVQEGMVVNNNSEKVKESVKWGLDFHLINHPLDCPICDQAGECGLQEQYMEYGQYDSEMAERKVKKRKVVDLGPTVVLDSERCILCSRCVRFTDEVSKTNELGIFNRGDRSEIGTFENKPLDNNYSLNTVDICPVGALTSKDFRFKQRVWYLKDKPSVCQGCATGCNVNVYFNKSGVYRVKPRHNEDINGYWMCDKGRDTYKFVNKDNRMIMGQIKTSQGSQMLQPGAVAKQVEGQLDASSTAVVLTGQYTSEEYQAIGEGLIKAKGIKQVYHWVNNEDDFDSFDGLLFRGDQNPNTKGLLKMLDEQSISSSWNQLVEGLENGSIKTLIVAGPENQSAFPDLEEKVKLFGKAENLVWMSAGKVKALDALENNIWMIPLKTFVEKSGTFVNYSGVEQKIYKMMTVVPNALTLVDAASLLSGQEIKVELPEMEARLPSHVTKEVGVKNEFVYRRGPQ